MSQPKHTPGPWKLSDMYDYGIVSGDEFLVCKYEVSEDNEPQDLANARLIASAPDLFEALERLVHRLELDAVIKTDDAELNSELNNAYKVLAKTRGES